MKEIPSDPLEKPFIVGINEFKPKEGQVWGLERIKVGARFIKHHLTGIDTPFTVLSMPDKSGWVTVAHDSNVRPWRISLADMGVIPYESGIVNVANYLTKVESSFDEKRERQVLGAWKLQSPYWRDLSVATSLIIAAAECEDEVKRLAFLRSFANSLRKGKQALVHMSLSISDILYILNRSYQTPHSIASKVIGAFKGLY